MEVLLSLWIITFLSLGLLTPAEGFLNVFIDQHEMVKLMDLDAELFYVRHGIVNHFAMSFVVPVPEQVHDLTFSWQSLVDTPIRYSLSIEYESQLGGLLPPHINVPVQGHIPNDLSTFTIRLLCTGNVSEEVPVGIHLEIEGHPHLNNTLLTFKRNKICVRDETLLETNQKNLSEESVVFKMIVFAFTFLLVSSVILVTCYCRGSLTRDTNKGNGVYPQTSYTMDESSSYSASSSSSSRTMSTLAKSTTSRQPQLHYDHVEYGGGYRTDLPRPRPPSVLASCSSIYETIVESGHKLPLPTMHSHKTCGACCSGVGEKTVYDGVTIAGLVSPTATNNTDRRSLVTGGAGPAIYEQPEEATIRWPAPPLFILEDEQQRSVKQNLPLINCYTNKRQQGVKLETRLNMTPGGTIDRRREGVGLELNPIRVGLWNADVCNGTGRESCTYYEPVHQHI